MRLNFEDANLSQPFLKSCGKHSKYILPKRPKAKYNRTGVNHV